MKALEKTYLYMQHYREIGQFVDDLKANKERNIDEKDMETVIIFDSINRALKRIQEDAMTAGYVYKYNAFVMHYIDGIPYESIRMILNCGKNTPKKWSDKIMKLLSIKIFGIRGIENETVQRQGDREKFFTLPAQSHPLFSLEKNPHEKILGKHPEEAAGNPQRQRDAPQAGKYPEKVTEH